MPITDDDTLLSRIEDAGLNASAPPQQRWLDGWLLRFSPGKARRARCINAVATGRMSWAEKIRLATPVFRDAGLPLVVRITPFTQPAGLDADLAAAGYAHIDDTAVMVLRDLQRRPAPPPPAGHRWVPLGADDFAQAVGGLRGSSAAHIAAHAERLRHSPVPYHGWALGRDADGVAVACGQVALESGLAGLYDVFTDPRARRSGLATLLCEHLLSAAASAGAEHAYLQVEADNDAASRIYRRMGFVVCYGYHYRQPG